MQEQVHITPTEAVALTGHIPYDLFGQADNIAELYYATLPQPLYGKIFLYGTLYQAGLIDGIRRERARRKVREESLKLDCPQSPVNLTAAAEEVDTYRKLIIRFISGIESEKALRAILFVAQRYLKNKAGERQQTPVAPKEGLDRISRYINRRSPEGEAS